MRTCSRFLLIICLMVAAVVPATAQHPEDDRAPAVLSMEERADVVNTWLQERLDTVLPTLMRREDVDLWIVSAREYNEDPIIETMLPATWMAARRRTMLVFYDRGPDEGVERLAISRYDVGDLFPSAWDPDEQPDQWARLAEIVSERDPESIALNTSETFALADGMTASEMQQLESALSETHRERIVSGEALAIGWLETRTQAEHQAYRHINRLAHSIIAEGLSEAVIQPGITTTDDVEWWYRDRIRDLNLTAWFHPSVSVQRANAECEDGDFSSDSGPTVIQPGDLVHMDLGITYLRLNTDTQRNAYVLRPGETEAPAGLQQALRQANRVQDLLTDQFETGRSGNAILSDALAAAESEGLDATIYTHPLGYHGHGAGPTIGLWDQQDGVSGWGDYPLYANTAHSIELNAAVPIPEWDDQEILMKVEEDAFFDGDTVTYHDGRQTELYLVPRQR
ncbi:MAG: M24 family metallopeptidase [Longimonas sp.]|uniref:M24 family metallopeptidase n=1 Tax=Longimonas sp. TaxID=2039626 RepID=UPI003975E604